MADPKDKSWLDKAEDYASDSYDQQRTTIPPWDDVGRVKHDVEVGLMKGVYGGVKSLLSGAIDLGRLLTNPIAQVELAQKAWPVAVKLAKETYIGHFGTQAEKQDQGERTIAFAKEVYASFEKDWKKAEGTDGKRTELAAKWVGRVGFEVGALFVGAGEAKAAIKGGEIVGDLGKLKEGAAILEEVTQTCKTVKLTRAELEAEWAAKEAAEAAEAAKAADAAKAAKAADEAVAAAKAKQPATALGEKGVGIPEGVVKEGDLVYGKYKKEPQRLPFWARERGGKVATDFDVSTLPGPPTRGEEIGPALLEKAAQDKMQVHFDLNGVDTGQALSGKGPHANSATSLEIKYLRDNWGKFDPKPKFYRNGGEVKPPWQ